MPIKPLQITDLLSPLIAADSAATDVSDTSASETGVVTDKYVKGKSKKKRPGHQGTKTVPKSLHPRGLARLFGRLDSGEDEPEEVVNIGFATKQLEDLKFTPPIVLGDPIPASQKIRFGLYDRFAQSTSIVVESSGGNPKAYVFEYVYGHLDFEIVINSSGQLVIDPEKISLPFGIFARESGSLMSGGQYRFYDLEVTLLSNGWIRIRSKLTGQKVHYAVIKAGNKICLRRYIGPTPYGLETVRTIEALEPCQKTFAANPENRIVETSNRRFAQRPAMHSTVIAPQPKPIAPAPTPTPTPAMTPFVLSMDIFYDWQRQTAQLESLIGSLQEFQAAESVIHPKPTTVFTAKTPGLDRFLDGHTLETQKAIAECLDALGRDFFHDLFGGRRRRRKKPTPILGAPTVK
jgi:hypothetical protein